MLELQVLEVELGVLAALVDGAQQVDTALQNPFEDTVHQAPDALHNVLGVAGGLKDLAISVLHPRLAVQFYERAMK
jgi:hypothetical protein